MKLRIVYMMLIFMLLAVPFLNAANATTYEQVFKLASYPSGPISYSLTVSLTSSLYNYYASQSHYLASSSDFAKFITPYAVKPIADALWGVYSDDEVFADGVLSLVQQIQYKDSPEVYPVETLKLNYGDCGSLSLLTASILKAGGLDVVLLEYPSEEHLNVGVNLQHNPTLARSNPYYVNFNGKRYYVAESTGNSFPDGWRVGECPTDLTQTVPEIISIDGYPQTAPGQVSASYESLKLLQISITVSSTYAMENSVVNIGGTITAPGVDEVSIYVSSFTGAWQVLATAQVDSTGHFVYRWTPAAGGIYYLQASWSGNEKYAGADSQAVTLYVIPLYALIAAGLGVILLVLLAVFWLMNRRIGMPSAAQPDQPNQPMEPPNQGEEQSQRPPEATGQSEQSSTNEPPAQTSAPQSTPQENTMPLEAKPEDDESRQSTGDAATTTDVSDPKSETMQETSQPSSQAPTDQQPQAQEIQPQQSTPTSSVGSEQPQAQGQKTPEKPLEQSTPSSL